MSRLLCALILCGSVSVLGCGQEDELTAPGDAASPPVLASDLPSASGGGHFTIGTIGDAQFGFTAVQFAPEGAGEGHLKFSIVFGGELVEFFGSVTCVTFDPANARVWVGGIVTKNNSTHPAFTGEIHEPGRDIWFRAVDYGEGDGAAQPDRSTFVGFEGSAGIITSEEYCEVQPWPGPPDDVQDARTNPVTGNVQVTTG